MSESEKLQFSFVKKLHLHFNWALYAFFVGSKAFEFVKIKKNTLGLAPMSGSSILLLAISVNRRIYLIIYKKKNYSTKGFGSHFIMCVVYIHMPMCIYSIRIFRF